MASFWRFFPFPVGYWATENGKNLQKLAMFQLDTYKQGGLRPFGTIQEVATSGVGLFGLSQKTLENLPSMMEDQKPAATAKVASLKPPPASGKDANNQGSNSADDQPDDKMVEGILKKGSYTSFLSLYSQACECANNKERVSILWRGLHRTHQELLNSIREEEASSSNKKNLQGETVSAPTNMSGRKTSNARTKRKEDVFREQAKKKRKEGQPKKH